MLQNVRVTVLSISELLRENQHESKKIKTIKRILDQSLFVFICFDSLDC